MGKRTWGENSPTESVAIITACQWSVSFRHKSYLCHRAAGQAAVNEQSWASSPSHCSCRVSVAYLAMRSAHDSQCQPSSWLSVWEKELVLSHNMHLLSKGWKNDLETERPTGFLSMLFIFPKVATRPAYTPLEADCIFFLWGPLGFCLWSWNLAAVICQQRYALPGFSVAAPPNKEGTRPPSGLCHLPTLRGKESNQGLFHRVLQEWIQSN